MVGSERWSRTNLVDTIDSTGVEEDSLSEGSLSGINVSGTW